LSFDIYLLPFKENQFIKGLRLKSDNSRHQAVNHGQGYKIVYFLTKKIKPVRGQFQNADQEAHSTDLCK
jgi:hypothetical protein